MGTRNLTMVVLDGEYKISEPEVISFDLPNPRAIGGSFRRYGGTYISISLLSKYKQRGHCKNKSIFERLTLNGSLKAGLNKFCVRLGL